MNGSVCLSVRPSVCHTFLTMFPSSYHHKIFRSYYQWQKWHPCKRSRSKVKVTEVTTQLYRFRTVTPVWIHIWWWNDAYSLIMVRRGALLFLAATKQLYDWFSPSVCPSVTPFHHVPIIVSSWNFQELLPVTEVTSMQKVKVTEVTTQLYRFRTVTPVWIHIWWWNDAYSLMMLRRGALLFFKVIRQISRSHSSKKRRIWPRLGVSGL